MAFSAISPYVFYSLKLIPVAMDAILAVGAVFQNVPLCRTSEEQKGSGYCCHGKDYSYHGVFHTGYQSSGIEL